MRTKTRLATLGMASVLLWNGVGIARAQTATVPAAFSITGSGNGHGVGMSQWGARGMAAAGSTYSDIIGHYYPGTTLTASNAVLSGYRNDLIRVGIIQDAMALALRGEGLGTPGGNLDITADGTTTTVSAGAVVTITMAAGKAHVVLPNLATIDTAHLTVKWNGTAANAANPGVVNIAAGTTAATASAGLGALCGNYLSGATVSGSCNHRYRYGSLDIDAGAFGDSTADLNVVVTQRLDDEYIRGIGEVPSSWPIESLRAQTVAARSYALATVIGVNSSSSSVSVTGFTRKVRPSCRCQVLDDTSDQNYVGFAKEYATQGSRWVDAVDATAPSGHGIVVTYGTTVVKTFFAASTGGRTQAVRDVWGSTSMPWLASVDDHWSLDAPNPDAAWVDSISQSNLVANLNSALSSAYSRATSGGLTCSKVQFADVATASVLSRYASGGVREIGIADSAGNTAVVTIKTALGCTNISADRLRSMLGVKSTYVTALTPSDSVIPGSTALTVKPLKAIGATGLAPVMVNPRDTAMRGVISPAQYGTTVVLQELLSQTWTDVATATTNYRGTWALTWSAPTIGQHQMRVLARNAVNSKTTKPVNIAVVGQLTLNAPLRAARSSTVHLTGTTVPAVAGVTLIIERARGTGWRRLTTVTTAADGSWSTDVATPRTRAIRRYRVRTIDPQLGRITSRIRRVAIR